MSQNKVKFGLEQVHIAFMGVAQTESIEVTDPPGTDGEITITITADTLLGEDSPHDIVVPLASETHTNVTKVASTIVNVLNDDSVINSVFQARHDGGTIYLTTLVARSNDSTLDISFTDTATTGATMGTSTAVEEGATGWGKPQAVKGAVNFSSDPEGDSSEFYADNTKYYTHTSNNGYTGELEIANVPDDILAEMLGMTIDNNDMLVESSDDEVKEFALMGQIQGDERNRRFVYYRCKASRPSEENSTTESSITPSTDTVSITMLPLEDQGKIIKGVMELSNTNQAAYDSFFDSVTLPDVS
ncbi:major tail protein [Sporohalobacter salinus]|uniref:major tail protein n=1 Tax=Sporohalobacter salinus TaxID=1494606 RepID=UPI0019615055|nr:major tail protein [Sporohalobacter salinus]MBM7624782.1 phi13 family phage major tail protein [Sporohalobacter salinus]